MTPPYLEESPDHLRKILQQQIARGGQLIQALRHARAGFAKRQLSRLFDGDARQTVVISDRLAGDITRWQQYNISALEKGIKDIDWKSEKIFRFEVPRGRVVVKVDYDPLYHNVSTQLVALQSLSERLPLYPEAFRGSDHSEPDASSASGHDYLARPDRNPAHETKGRSPDSTAVERALRPHSAQHPPMSRRAWALLVGVSEYKHAGWNLGYADRDAQELYSVITTSQGGAFHPERIELLTNKEATTFALTNALREFLKKPDRDDLVLLFFACHGAPDPDRPKNTYLLSHDAVPGRIAGTALPMLEIQRAVRDTLHAERVIILADTCHSGAIAEGYRYNAESVNAYWKSTSDSRGGVALLSSAEASETAREHQKWGGGHGVFTHYVLEGLRGKAKSRPGEGWVRVGELFEYVRENVKKATDNKQHPWIGPGEWDRDLPIGIPGQSPKPT